MDKRTYQTAKAAQGVIRNATTYLHHGQLDQAIATLEAAIRHLKGERR